MSKVRAANSIPESTPRLDNGEEKTGCKHRRRIQALLPDEEMKREFDRHARQFGGESAFVRVLFAHFKRCEVRPAPQEKMKAA
jgi:hypothetical protein